MKHPGGHGIVLFVPHILEMSLFSRTGNLESELRGRRGECGSLAAHAKQPGGHGWVCFRLRILGMGELTCLLELTV
jgi:hypothetical protein